VSRILGLLAPIIGRPSVVHARRVVDRFGRADAGLLASGIAYNATLALVPLALVVAAIAGLVLADAESQRRFVDAIVAVAPPLAGVIDEIVRGLASASTSLSVVGLLLAMWGTSRLFASLESGIAQVFTGVPRRGLVDRTARRLRSVVLMAMLVAVALLLVPGLSAAGDVIRATSDLAGTLLTVALFALAVAIAAGAVAAVYRYLAPIPTSWASVRGPAFAVALALLVITRVFTIVAPKLFGANAVYGTLGAIFLGLAWLNVVFLAILLGAAWIAEEASADVRDID
jgi:membrane protein